MVKGGAGHRRKWRDAQAQGRPGRRLRGEVPQSVAVAAKLGLYEDDQAEPGPARDRQARRRFGEAIRTQTSFWRFGP
jgi:hypothetical protein